MKKNLTSALFVLFASTVFHANSQWINSISYSLVNPTAADTIYFYADLSFSSGNCDQHTQTLFVQNNSVYAGALHCLGMLTFICNYTDTFKVNPLPAGNYSFIFHVDAGALPSPCTPGIAPGPTDSISFTVNAATAIQQVKHDNSDFSIYPNPADGKFNVQCLKFKTGEEFIITDVTGKLLYKSIIADETLHIELGTLNSSPGVYFCTIVSDSRTSEIKKLILLE
ncbi:MAG: T9SS type A sorting domain-containing protein [Bacteroidia bacterium]